MSEPSRSDQSFIAFLLIVLCIGVCSIASTIESINKKLDVLIVEKKPKDEK